MCYAKINEFKKQKKKRKWPFRDTSGVSRTDFIEKGPKFSMLEVLDIDNDVFTVLW